MKISARDCSSVVYSGTGPLVANQNTTASGDPFK
jgi:hypothetical protein